MASANFADDAPVQLTSVNPNLEVRRFLKRLCLTGFTLACCPVSNLRRSQLTSCELTEKPAIASPQDRAHVCPSANAKGTEQALHQAFLTQVIHIQEGRDLEGLPRYAYESIYWLFLSRLYASSRKRGKIRIGFIESDSAEVVLFTCPWSDRFAARIVRCQVRRDALALVPCVEWREGALDDKQRQLFKGA